MRARSLGIALPPDRGQGREHLLPGCRLSAPSAAPLASGPPGPAATAGRRGSAAGCARSATRRGSAGRAAPSTRPASRGRRSARARGRAGPRRSPARRTTDSEGGGQALVLGVGEDRRAWRRHLRPRGVEQSLLIGGREARVPGQELEQVGRVGGRVDPADPRLEPAEVALVAQVGERVVEQLPIPGVVERGIGVLEGGEDREIERREGPEQDGVGAALADAAAQVVRQSADELAPLLRLQPLLLVDAGSPRRRSRRRRATPCPASRGRTRPRSRDRTPTPPPARRSPSRARARRACRAPRRPAAGRGPRKRRTRPSAPTAPGPRRGTGSAG